MTASRLHITCTLFLGVALATLLASCAPKPAFVNAAEKACAEARTADARAKANTAGYDSLTRVLAEKQAVKVQLERLRSRVKTKQMTDADLAEWLQDYERKPEPDTVATTPPDSTAKAAPDTAASVPTDTVSSAAPVDTAAVSPAPESAPADTSSAPAVTPAPEESTPSDTTGTTTPAPETPTPGESSGETGSSPAPESGTAAPGAEESTEPAPGGSTESGE